MYLSPSYSVGNRGDVGSPSRGAVSWGQACVEERSHHCCSGKGNASGKLSSSADLPLLAGCSPRGWVLPLPANALIIYIHLRPPGATRECLRPGCHSNSYSLKDSASRDPG